MSEINVHIAGEDRWLCTLLLQRGYRVEYSAASDAYTHCPEGFNEFYNQRRRWVPSTMANIMDLLTDYKRTIKINDNISMPYIGYQVCYLFINMFNWFPRFEALLFEPVLMVRSPEQQDFPVNVSD